MLFFDKHKGSAQAATRKLWFYDFRTNLHFTLKTKRLQRADLDEFVRCYNPQNRHARKPTWSGKAPQGRWRSFDYDGIVQRDKVNLDIFWLRDESLEGADSLPELDVIAAEIAEDLEAALEQFRAIAEDLAVAPEPGSAD